VGAAAERFAEDGLRPMRALRFASTLGFSCDNELLAAIPDALPITAKVSGERLRDEFEKIARSPSPSIALNLMNETGLLRLLLPELADCVGIEQKGYHRFDVFTHSVLACEYAARFGADEAVRLAALLHDIGKPATAKLDERGIWTFYNHEKVSEKMTRALMFRLRFPNALIEKVAHLIACHMFHYEDNWSAAAVRRFLIRVGEENLDALFALRRADAYGMQAVVPPPDCCLALLRRIDDERAKRNALSLKNLAVNGCDRMAIGFPAGKRLGVVLNQLLEAVIEDPAMNTREKLLEIAGKIGET
jgi:putative nucleotidyltransferase with HDIG domain